MGDIPLVSFLYMLITFPPKKKKRSNEATCQLHGCVRLHFADVRFATLLCRFYGKGASGVEKMHVEELVLGFRS